MAHRDHTKSLNTTERARWWEAFMREEVRFTRSLTQEIEIRTKFADAALEEYRRRVTWREPT